MPKGKIKEKPSQASPVPEVPLAGELAEFRDALRAEVEAAKRASAASATPLSNGRLLRTLAGAFQYQFGVETALDLPGDTPGELRVPGQDAMRATIVSIEGLTITLSVERNLGDFIPHATLQSNLSMLLLKLIERIEAKATLPNPAGDRLLVKTPPSGEAEQTTNAALGLGEQNCLNAKQLNAVESVLGRDTTYIWGPPGTGKTYTIGVIGAELLRRGKTLLLVSHTNVAVDGAILEIANAVRARDPEAIEHGRVIRVGTPKDARFDDTDNKPLLLSFQRERKAEALVGRKDLLTAERQRSLPREAFLNQLIVLHEWLVDAEPDVARFRATVARIIDFERQSHQLERSIEAVENGAAKDETLRPQAEAALGAMQHQAACRQRLEQLNTELVNVQDQMVRAEAETQAADAEFQTALKVQPYREQLSKRRPIVEASRFVQAMADRQSDADAEVQRADLRLQESHRLLAETTSLNWMTRKWRGLPSPEEQQAVVADRCRQFASAQSAQAQVAATHSLAVEELAYTERLKAALEPYAHLGLPAEHKARVLRCKREHDRLRATFTKLEGAFAEAAARWRAIDEAIVTFQRTGQGDPREMLARIAESRTRLSELRARLKAVLVLEQDESERLEAEIAPRLRLLTELGFSSEINPESDLQTTVAAIEHAVAQARQRADHVPLAQAKDEHAAILSRLAEIAAELHSIEDALRRIEETVMREASVIGATLTASYLRDAIQNRRFDTVILDEASMAAIPALWIAASVCDRALVVVGDFKQLPPVVIANPEKQKGDRGAELAQKWLGVDPFALAKLNHSGPWPAYFVGLQEQRRMHPEISIIVNELVYGGFLHDHKRVTEPEHNALPWAKPEWQRHEPVLLVDTGPLHAWVTSVARGTGGSVSRLNFMSATVCADIAAAMLSNDTDIKTTADAGEKSDARILVVSPYRPHTKLVDLLLQHAGLGPRAVAGTVHSFQGSEEDVVIFDLVNDEPGRLVGLFAAKYNETHKRMFNVALTRAKKRLIIVGDFSYCLKHGKNAFVGKEFIPFLLKRYPMVDAKSIIPDGLAGRAAAAKSRLVGGPIESPHERLIVRQEEFFPLLYTDLQKSRERVVIYSPFMTRRRLAEMEAPLKAAIENGVAVYVVTKSLAERDRRSIREYRDIERSLGDWGVRVIHKRAMHEKLVLIDSEIVWAGSLNALSFSDTQEVMWRYRSPRVFEECSKKMQVNEFLHQFEAGSPKCPICGFDLMAAEGTTASLYLKCSRPRCCFTQGIDDNSIRDGMVLCKRCGCGGDVQLCPKDVDGRARWICKNDPTHKRIVKAMHLQLPKMRAQISPQVLMRVERLVCGSDKAALRPASGDDASQGWLFGDDEENS